jgi:putative hydrolase of the HAD superfamily
MDGIRGIVFDLDDTLYPQVEYKRSGFKSVAHWAAVHLDLDYGECFEQLERILLLKGPSYHHMFDDLISHFGLDHEIVPEMVRVFVDHVPQIACYPKVPEMLNRLGCTFRLGILTDGPVTVQQCKIASLQLERHVDLILYSDSLSLEKPEPALFAWFEQQFSLPGTSLVYVGDNPAKDFIGARSRRWMTIRVLTGEHADVDVLPGYEADMTKSLVTDVESWVWSQRAE